MNGKIGGACIGLGAVVLLLSVVGGFIGIMGNGMSDNPSDNQDASPLYYGGAGAVFGAGLIAFGLWL